MPMKPMMAAFSQRSRIQARFEELGALSPETSRPLAEVGAVDSRWWAGLLDEGAIREGPPGRFYWYAPASQPWNRNRLIKTLAFWLLILLIPIVLVQLSSR